MNTQNFYTPSEYAEYYRYADSRPVLRLIKQGKLPAVRRPDGRYLIPAQYLKGANEEAKAANANN